MYKYMLSPWIVIYLTRML